MYKLHHEHNNITDIFYRSENTRRDVPHVIETGHSYAPPGYTPIKMYRSCYVLHYAVSGRVTYYGQTMDAPCMFLLVPQNLHFFRVENHPTAQYEHFWIMFSGPDMESWLIDAGIPVQSVCLPCPYIGQAREILQRLQTEVNYLGQNDHYYMLAGLCQLLSLHCAANGTQENNKNAALVQAIRNYIHENYAAITGEDELANLVHLSTRHMHKIFKEAVGVPPIRYLNEYRVGCAKKILAEQDLPISAISETLGFSNPNYFCYVFQKHCEGVTPSAYRKLRRQK